jgi:hypothetical protein
VEVENQTGGLSSSWVKHFATSGLVEADNYSIFIQIQALINLTEQNVIN